MGEYLPWRTPGRCCGRAGAGGEKKQKDHGLSGAHAAALNPKFGSCWPGLDRSLGVMSFLVSVALFSTLTNTLLWDLPGDVLAAKPASPA